MVTFLHISDLHFVKNATSYNSEQILLNEAKEIFQDIPLAEKFLIITGDFHNYNETSYEKAESFLRSLISVMGIDIHKDVFVIPGNHDDGNSSLLEELLSKEDPNWQIHNKAAIAMIKSGNMEYIKERSRAFRAYSQLMQQLGIYNTSDGIDYPANTHVRNWRGKLNILHLNTAIVSDGKTKIDQMTDVDAAADTKTWENLYQDYLPSIALGHNNFYDIIEKQRKQLSSTFYLKNVSAYMCGDNHRHEDNPERQMIRIESGHGIGKEIPNIVAMRGIADEDDSFSNIGFCINKWDEKTDKVTVEFRKWTKNNIDRTIPYGENGHYEMRRKSVNKQNAQKAITNQPDPKQPYYAEKRDYAYAELENLYNNLKKFRASYKIADIDEINHSTNKMETSVSILFEIGEECKYSDKELSEIMMCIIEQYNKFVVQYVNYFKSKDISSDIAQGFEQRTNKEFYKLIDLILLKRELIKPNNVEFTKNVLFKVSFSEQSGSLFIYSSDSNSDIKYKTTITQKMWDKFTECCKELLIAVFSKTTLEKIQIKRSNKLGDYYCAPDNGYNFYDKQYRIDFKVRLIRNDDNSCFDSVRFDIDDCFEISLFKQGNYVFRQSDENTKLGEYSINEENLVKAAENMLRFTTNSDNVVVSRQFRRNVYDDGSGGYVLDYIIPD